MDVARSKLCNPCGAIDGTQSTWCNLRCAIFAAQLCARSKRAQQTRIIFDAQQMRCKNYRGTDVAQST
eukprot:183118-Pyramimonas_sp.AAC.1